jgi:hydroxymethylbilane synthase
VSPARLVEAMTEREAPFDMLVTATGVALEELPPGARVGTSSPRRVAQLVNRRSDITPCELRGNVDTRVRKLLAGEYDAIVLAAAGLRRLGIQGIRPVRLTPEQMLPCAGQGALGIESRVGDADCRAVLEHLEHAPARREVDAERALLAALGGGCSAPIAALAREQDGRLTLAGAVGDPAGARLLRSDIAGDPADGVRMARELAARLLAMGAGELIRQVKAS